MRSKEGSNSGQTGGQTGMQCSSSGCSRRAAQAADEAVSVKQRSDSGQTAFDVVVDTVVKRPHQPQRTVSGHCGGGGWSGQKVAKNSGQNSGQKNSGPAVAAPVAADRGGGDGRRHTGRKAVKKRTRRRKWSSGPTAVRPAARRTFVTTVTEDASAKPRPNRGQTAVKSGQTVVKTVVKPRSRHWSNRGQNRGQNSAARRTVTGRGGGGRRGRRRPT